MPIKVKKGKQQQQQQQQQQKSSKDLTLPPPQLPTNSPILRAIQGGTSGAVLGLFLALPTWVKSKRVVPPRDVFAEVGVNAAISASSEFVESSVERIRGRTDDLWAPFIGTTFPYVAIEAGKVAVALKKKEKIDWKERSKNFVKQISFPVCSTLLIRSILLKADKKQSIPALNK